MTRNALLKVQESEPRLLQVLFHEDGSVKGIGTNDVGIAKDGSPKVCRTFKDQDLAISYSVSQSGNKIIDERI